MAGYDSPKSRGMRKKFEDENLDKYGQTTTIAGGIKRKPKNKIVGRDRSNTSRQGVGTLEKVKPKRKDMTGVNQTPITLKDVGKSTAKGAAEGVAYGLGGIGVGALKKLLAKVKDQGTKALKSFNAARRKNNEREITIRDLGMYGAKKGGLVKKKSVEGVTKSGKRKTAAKKTTRKPAARVARKGIDGIAKRGKTRAARSR